MNEFNQAEYIKNFNKENYDCISLRVPKGYKEKFKQLAASHNLSMAAYIVQLVNEAED